MLKHIPNLITLGNLFCGLLAILFAVGGHLNMAGSFILLGAFLDFFDGMLARLLNVEGELGKQLDSLADLITFGLAPAFIVFQLFFWIEDQSFFNPLADWPERNTYSQNYWAYTAWLIPLFSALRLAKFNIDTRQSDGFIGLPTPVNALFFISIPFMMHFQAEAWISTFLGQKTVLAILCVVMSYLLVAEIPLLSLKFKTLSWQENKMRYTLLIISVLLLCVFRFVAVPIILLLYPILSIINKSK
tara:strand:- start:7527 stop:8261 length:735 start_codon:yes stop_codon:yes gene_type:complete